MSSRAVVVVLMRLLRDQLARYRGVLIAVVVFQTIQTILSLYLPTLNADIIDKGVIRGDTAYIWHTGALMLAITLVQILFAIAAVYFGSRAAMGFGRDVRTKLFHRVTSFSAREVGAFGAPSLITRITNDVQQVQMLVLMTCTLLVVAPITFVGGVVLALHQDIDLSGILLVSIPALLLGVGSVILRMVPQFRVMQVRIDSLNEVLREQITGIRVVRAFVREPDESERFAGVNHDVTATALRAGQLMALLFPIVMLVLNASSVAAIWLGADRIASGQLQIGEMIAFLSYLVQILMAVMLATFMLVLVPRASVCADRIQEVLDTESSVVPPAHPVTEVTGRGSLELRDVSFHYPGADEPVLDGISFTSLAGQTTAIIGSTGAGKTTLVNLVARLADPTAGVVLMDGVDIRQLSPDLLWSRIGLVPQRPYLFSGTVATQPALRQPVGQRRRAVDGARDRPGAFVRRSDAGRARRADPPGRHERVRRPAPASGDRPGAGAPPRDLPLRRLVLRARPGDRRPPAGGARAGDRRQHGDRRGPARVDDQDRRPDPRARGRPHGRVGHAP